MKFQPHVLDILSTRQVTINSSFQKTSLKYISKAYTSIQIAME